jgi:hypothetical protein
VILDGLLTCLYVLTAVLIHNWHLGNPGQRLAAYDQ